MCYIKLAACLSVFRCKSHRTVSVCLRL